MITLLILTLLLILAAKPVGAYRLATKPAGYVDNHLHTFRLHTNETRARKCLSRFDIGSRSLPAVGTLYRRNIRMMWKRRHMRTINAGSRCFADMLMAWYRNSGAACVHSKEGAWNDPNPPYWGGFQADLSFQQTYGAEYYARKGTADNWLPIEQIHMAWRGWRTRGWQPWPNTARACGLL